MAVRVAQYVVTQRGSGVTHIRRGRSPSGDWCNDCKWAYTGLGCDRCGRTEVDITHKAPDGSDCRVGPKAKRLG